MQSHMVGAESTMVKGLVGEEKMEEIISFKYSWTVLCKHESIERKVRERVRRADRQ